MADFNPDTNIDQGANWTNASEGTVPNKAWGSLFKGAGDVMEGAVKALDMHNMQQIKEGLYAGVDQAVYNAGGPAPLTVSQGEVPPELKGYGDRLKLLKQARQAGTLRDSQFQINIDTMAKEMRTRFPGYRSDIDGMLSTILAHSTANDVRKEMLAEWDAEHAEQTASRSKQETFINQNLDIVPPALLEQFQQGNPEAYTKIQTFVAGRKAYEHQQEWQDKQRTYNKNQRTEDTDNQLLDEAAQYAEESLRIGKAGLTVGDIRRSLTEFDPSKPPSPEELEQMAVALTQYKAQVQTGWMSRVNQPWDREDASSPRYASAASKEALAQSQELVVGQIDALSKVISEKQLNLLNAAGEIADMRLDRDYGRALAGPDGAVLSLIANAQKIGGQLGVEAAFKSMTNIPADPKDPNGPRLMVGDVYDQAISKLITLQTVFGDNTTSLNGAVQQNAQATATPSNPQGKVSAQSVMAATRAARDILVNPDSSPQTVEQAINRLYSSANADFLNSFANQESQLAVFKTLVSPPVQARIKEASERTPQLWQNYKAWSLNAFHSLFAQDAQTVRFDGQGQTGILAASALELTINPKTGKIEKDWNFDKVALDMTKMPAMISPLSVFESFARAWGVNKAINNLNEYIARVAPILQEDGDDVHQVMLGLLQHEGVGMDAKYQGTFYQMLFETLQAGGSGNPEDSLAGPLGKEGAEGVKDAIKAKEAE